MEIISIFAHRLYSMSYDGDNRSIYNMLFERFKDLDYLESFFEQNKGFLEDPTWSKCSVPELAMQQVYEEAMDLEEWIEELVKNSNNNVEPDLDSAFKSFGGLKYEMMWERIPMKMYGTQNPSLLRIYAIRLEKNCYIVTGGGIKLTKTFQDTPGLGEEPIKQMDIALDYLKKESIIDADDI